MPGDQFAAALFSTLIGATGDNARKETFNSAHCIKCNCHSGVLLLSVWWSDLYSARYQAWCIAYALLELLACAILVRNKPLGNRLSCNEQIK